MRATTIAAAALLCLSVPAASRGVTAATAAGSLCDGLFVPEGYAQTCETRIEGATRTEQAVVRTSGGATSLAQLTLRPLDRAEAPAAWSEPDRWLEEQVVFDLSGIGAALRGLGGADGQGAAAHPAAQAMIDGLMATLAGWGRLPLQSCAKAEASDDARRELRCRWGVAPLALSMNQRLVEAGDRRFAVTYWAADEQRMRHLEAIANSFAPPAG